MPARRLALLLVAIAPSAHATDAIPWKEAPRHAGRLVRIEGFVRAATRTDNRVTLRFDPDDARALTVTLLIPLVNDLPTAPETIYRERTVRVLGRVTRAGGHVDMIVTDPNRIEIVGLTPPPPPPADARPRATAPSPAAAPTPPAAGPTPRTAPPPPSLTPAEPHADVPDAVTSACLRYVASRDALRDEALAATEHLRACLRRPITRCTKEADAIAAPVARLERIEQTIRERCPAD